MADEQKSGMALTILAMHRCSETLGRLASWLYSEKHRVIPTQCEDDAAEAVKREKIDLIITDPSAHAKLRKATGLDWCKCGTHMILVAPEGHVQTTDEIGVTLVPHTDLTKTILSDIITEVFCLQEEAAAA